MQTVTVEPQRSLLCALAVIHPFLPINNYIMFSRFARLLICLLIATAGLAAQDCTTLELAFSDITMAASDEGTANRSGVAFHPTFRLYYSVNGGSSNYPIDTYDAEGTRLYNPTQGFDYRGLWFNPAAATIEGNGFSDLGILVHNLNVTTGEPLGNGASVLAANQPNNQSAGDLDTDDNQIIYFAADTIYRYDRPTNNLASKLKIENLPVAIGSITPNVVVYLGCPEKEYGIYDQENRRLLYVNKTTGAYNGFTQLPVTAPQPTVLNMSYARNRLWLFNRTDRAWEGFFVTDAVTSSREPDQLKAEFSFFPNPTQNLLQVRSSEALSESLQVELINPLGQLLRRSAAFYDNTELNVRYLAKGTYFIRVVGTQSGKVSLTQAFTKQ